MSGNHTKHDLTDDPNISQLKEIYTVEYVKDYVIKNYPDSCAAYNFEYGCCVDGEVVELLQCFAYEILDLCGCGRPEDTWEVIRRVLHARLIAFSDHMSYDDICAVYNDSLGLDFKNNKIDSGIVCFILYILDSKGFTQHGSSIYGCWLTELGKMYLAMLTVWNEELEKGEG